MEIKSVDLNPKCGKCCEEEAFIIVRTCPNCGDDCSFMALREHPYLHDFKDRRFGDFVSEFSEIPIDGKFYCMRCGDIS